MIKKDKFTAIVLSAVFAASLIAGCGNSASSDSTDTTSEAEADDNTSDSEDAASSDTESDTSDSASDSDADESDADSESDVYKPGDSFEITSGDYAGSTLLFMGYYIEEESNKDKYKEQHPDETLDDSSELVHLEFMMKEPESSGNTEYGFHTEEVKKLTDNMSVNIDGGSILSEELSGDLHRNIYVSVPDGTKSFDLTYDNGTDKATFEVPVE